MFPNQNQNVPGISIKKPGQKSSSSNNNTQSNNNQGGFEFEKRYNVNPNIKDDFDAHTELIKRRTPSYIVLWLLVGIFSLLAIVPIFWIPAGVLAVYFVLVFQVYTYEPELSPIGVLRKSLLLVKGHFLSTFMLLALVGALTYCLIPQIINMICEMIKITEFLSKVITPLVSALPIAELNKLIAYAYLPPLKIEMITTIAVILLLCVLCRIVLEILFIIGVIWNYSVALILPFR